MFEVKAIANGYYGSKIRVPGEAFGIYEASEFSVNWMTTDDAEVLAYVRKQAKTPAQPTGALTDRQQIEHNAAVGRATRYADWLKRHKNEYADTPIATRRVNTGGTDGVVGAEIPKPGQKLSAPERIAAAKALTGRDDITTAKEADALLAAAQPLAGSDNDDRSRDMASDPADNAPTPDADADI